MGKVKIENKKVGLLDRVLNSVERVGNKLPDHVTIFFILCGVIFVLSAIISSQDVSAIHPSTGEKIIAINLLTKEQLKIFLGSIVSNFQSFAPTCYNDWCRNSRKNRSYGSINETKYKQSS